MRWGARLLRKVLHPAEVDVFHLRSRAGRPALGYLASRYLGPPLGHCTLLQIIKPPPHSRWAVKEATFKAFGQSRGEVLFTDMKVTNDGQTGSTTLVPCNKHSLSGQHFNIFIEWPTGKPVLQLEGKTKQLALRLGVNQIHLSISHERDYALAQVILE